MRGTQTFPPWERWERAYGVRLNQRQRSQVLLYLERLEHWNRHLNLTGLATKEERLRIHFFESFWAAEHFLRESRSLADVGSGAGFPGLAMLIYRPHLAVTLIEKNHKKMVFLKQVSRLLELCPSFFEGRGEVFDGWEGVEVASLRALRPSSELLTGLSRAKVRLLLLAGADQEELPGWKVIKRKKIPLSERRFGMLLQTGEPLGST
ncbi:MAG: 16S rRNA (guanine(527)-N(7))-methyltransferase RsmG [Acidobacteria bacterium]|nr:16S rRNA (guanine(527)-N(7))-methyltransferase RsmG [Acidobacteriota bacterium]